MLDDILETALAQEAPEETETPEAEAPAEETKPDDAETEEATEEEKPAEEPEATPAPEASAAAARAEEEALFDDKALSTPEGLKAARVWARAQRAKYSSIGSRLERKQTRLGEKVREFASERDAVRAERAQVAQFAQAVNGKLARLRSGSAAEILETFGELTGQDPKEFYREISHLMATNGKSNGKTSPETDQLKAKIEALEKTLAERAEAESHAAEEAAKDRILSVAVSVGKDATAAFPHIARLAAESPDTAREIREHLAELKIARYNAGSPLTDEEAAQDLEVRLAKALGPSPKTGPAPASGQAPPTAKPPKSLTSKDRSAPSQRRERKDETIEEMAQDKHLMGALFG